MVALRCLVNWLVVFSLPIWGGFFLVGAMFHIAFQKNNMWENKRYREILAGKKWIFSE